MNSIFFFSLIRYKKVLGQFTLYKPSKHDNKNFDLNQQNMYNIYPRSQYYLCYVFWKTKLFKSKHWTF